MQEGYGGIRRTTQPEADSLKEGGESAIYPFGWKDEPKKPICWPIV